MTLSQFSSWEGPSKEGLWTKMVLISIGLHFFVLALFLNVFPQGGVKRNLEPAYIVDLVSSTGEGPVGNKTKEPFPSPSRSPAQEETKPITIPKPVPEKTPPVKQDQSKMLDKAVEQLKRKVEQDNSLEKTFSRLKNQVKEEQHLEKTFSRLENQVKDEQHLEKALSQIEKKKQSSSTTGKGTGGSGTGTVSSSTPGTQDGLGIQFQLYHAALRSQIKKNWVLPEGLLKKSDISAEIMIRISRNGRIEDSRFEKKSGLDAFDQEVLRTLKKSEPLPPLPEGYPKGSYEVVLTFHSKELSGN